MKAKKITDHLFISTVYPGINIGLIVTEEGGIALDAPPIPKDAQEWGEYVTSVLGNPIRYTVLTDHHLARSLSAGILGAPIIAGRPTLEILFSSEGLDKQATTERWAASHPEHSSALGKQKATLPEITVSGQLVIQGSVPVLVETVAGAAPGSVWVRLPEEAALFAGDSVVIDTHPLLGNTPDSKAWLETLVRLRRPHSPAEIIVPGRGQVCEKEDTRPQSDYIQLVRRRIRSMHTANQHKNELPGLVEELLEAYPFKNSERDLIESRVLASLERIYDELRPENTGK
jgi:glyoxylase-like metal-dependent hydrolase (beta-lactamase superfamily II)